MLGDNKFKNPELEAATAQIEAEFNRIMKEGVSSSAGQSPRRTQGHLREDLAKDDFYKLMGEFYSGDMKRHASPTKRLIAQKNSTWEHKELMKQCNRTQ